VTVESASLDEEQKIWTVCVRNKNVPETSVIRTRHLVLAIGAGGQTPKMPELPNRVSCEIYQFFFFFLQAKRVQKSFRGEVLHSVDYKSATRWNGKAGIVVGSANTGEPIIYNASEGFVFIY
jgi:cation diffusion facilitator CzcD-associated flavoprotein CzcO